MEIGPDEFDKVHEVKVRVTHQGDGSLLSQSVAGFQSALPPDLNAGETLTTPLVVPLRAMIPEFGPYDVFASADGFTPRILTVYVLPVPPRHASTTVL
jgi:hypothetical protein